MEATRMRISNLFKPRMRRFVAALSIAAVTPLGALAPSAYAAEPYPSRPVSIIVPYAAGGVADAIARAIGQGLSEKWKQPVIIENRPGAAGNIGMAAGAKAAPDGHTLVLAPAGNLTVNPILFPRLSFDTAQAFAPIILLANSPNVLVAHPNVPVKTFRELIAYAKANPDKLNYASPGVGSGGHLAGELLKLEAGISTVHVTYNGMAPALNSVLGGHVELMFAAESTALPHIKAGKLVALAAASPARLAQLKNVPTIAESGYPGFDVTSWYSLVGQRGMPRELVQKIYTDAAAVLAQPDIRAKFEAQGVEPVGSNPEAFEKTIKTETAKWRDVVRRARIEAAN
jgi:tripartite-type tricarboxylate transporter receptor subunit TctC